MATHAYFTNDPTLSTGHQLHPPGFTGTNAQRVAYPTATLLGSEQWYETDTGLTYQWTGTVWGLFGGGVPGAAGSVITGTWVLASSVVLSERLAIV